MEKYKIKQEPDNPLLIITDDVMQKSEQNVMNPLIVVNEKILKKEHHH